MRVWQKSFVAASLAILSICTAASASGPFFLKNGDRVLFYGDSITEQRYWTVAIETYVRTRFPDLRVKFINSAVGGDRVTGGWAGPIDERLKRDVFPYKPNVVTIMLGMNDGEYRPWEESIAKTYEEGYRHIIQSLKQHLPGVKIVLIEPTPWDDLTQKPTGYDTVMSRYADFVRKLGEEDHLAVVDFHTPLIELIKQTQKEEPSLAGKIIPGRVHPGPSAELVMAQTMLKAWNAPATISDVAINASSSVVEASDNARVTNVSSQQGGISWTETDKSLPYPIMTLHAPESTPGRNGIFGPPMRSWPQFPPDPWGGPEQIFWPLPPLESSQINPVAALVAKISGMYQALDSENLRVTGLSGTDYNLAIDGKAVGKFSKDQLASGINLAEYDTPMMEQADKVLTLVWHRVDVRFYGWRAIQVPLTGNDSPGVQSAVSDILRALGSEQGDLIRQAHTAAQPVTHHYVLTPAAD